MNILHIEAEFIPHLGYQVNILSKNMAKKGHDVSILSTELKYVRSHQRVYLKQLEYNFDEKFRENSGVNVYRVPSWGVISDRHIWSPIMKRIREINPDIIFLHDNDTFVSIRYLLFNLRKINKPIIMDSHMVKFASKNRLAPVFYYFYRIFVTPIIVKNNIIVVRTVEDNFLQEAFNIPLRLTPLISFGSDTDLFKPNHNEKAIFRKKYQIEKNERIFIYAGKLSDDKNALFLASSLKINFTKCSNKPVFIIIGNTTGEYGQDVEKIFEQSENRIIRVPLQSYTNLVKYFQASDVGLIHFAGSLIYFDMQSSGLPVIWSNLEMNRVRSNAKTSKLFEPDSINDFRSKIQEYLEMDESELVIESNGARDFILENYSYNKITDDFLSLMKKEINYREESPFK